MEKKKRLEKIEKKKKLIKRDDKKRKKNLKKNPKN